MEGSSGGSQEAAAMAQVSWTLAGGGGGENRPLLHPQGHRGLTTRVGDWPRGGSGRAPGPYQIDWWINSSCRKLGSAAPTPAVPASHGDQAADGAKTGTRWS